MELRRHEDFWLLVGGPVPPGSSAITFGSLVIVRKRRAGSRLLLAHEAVHVAQYRRDGWVRFLVRYLGSYLRWRLRRTGHRGAYLRIGYEVEADWLARRRLQAEARALVTGPRVEA